MVILTPHLHIMCQDHIYGLEAKLRLVRPLGHRIVVSCLALLIRMNQHSIDNSNIKGLYFTDNFRIG